MEEITKDKSRLEYTRSMKDLLGVRVISKSGEKIGIVKDIRYGPRAMGIRGIIIKNSSKGPFYIGSGYIDIISDESIVLSIDPAILLLNKRVITYPGKVIGRVKKIERVGNTNSISKIHVKRFLHKAFIIKPSDIEKNGESIILKEGRHAER